MKTKLIQVRASEVLYNLIAKIAEGKGMTISEYVRYILQQTIDGQEKENNKA